MTTSAEHAVAHSEPVVSADWLHANLKAPDVKGLLMMRRLLLCPGEMAEMALLVEGLGVGGETSIEEYIIGHANEVIDDQDPTADKERITLYGSEVGQQRDKVPLEALLLLYLGMVATVALKTRVTFVLWIQWLRSSGVSMRSSLRWEACEAQCSQILAACLVWQTSMLKLTIGTRRVDKLMMRNIRLLVQEPDDGPKYSMGSDPTLHSNSSVAQMTSLNSTN